MTADKVVERYLEAIAVQDWDGVRSALSDEVDRRGPYGDNVHGREPYVAYLAELMPQLEGYAMDVAGVIYLDDGRRAFAELTERVTLNGSPTVTAEVLVLEIDEAGQISRVEIYIRQV